MISASEDELDAHLMHSTAQQLQGMQPESIRCVTRTEPPYLHNNETLQGMRQLPVPYLMAQYG